MLKTYKASLILAVIISLLAIGLGFWLGMKQSRPALVEQDNQSTATEQKAIVIPGWQTSARYVTKSGRPVVVDLVNQQESTQITAEMFIDSSYDEYSEIDPVTGEAIPPNLPLPDDTLIVNNQTIHLFVPDCQTVTDLRADLIVDEFGGPYSLVVSNYCQHPAVAKSLVEQIYQTYPLDQF